MWLLAVYVTVSGSQDPLSLGFNLPRVGRRGSVQHSFSIGKSNGCGARPELRSLWGVVWPSAGKFGSSALCTYTSCKVSLSFHVSLFFKAWTNFSAAIFTYLLVWALERIVIAVLASQSSFYILEEGQKFLISLTRRVDLAMPVCPSVCPYLRKLVSWPESRIGQLFVKASIEMIKKSFKKM